MSKRTDIAREFLKKGHVTNAEFASVGAVYTARNAIAEIRPEFEAKGLRIVFKAGKTFLENRWTVEPMMCVVEEPSGQLAFV